MLKNLAAWFKRFNQLRYIIGAISVAFISLVYFWKIGHLTAGMSPAEANTLTNSHSLHALYRHPLNAPHNFLLYLILKSGHHQLWLLRSTSAIWAIVFSLSFYRILRGWFGTFIGWLSTLVFATTPLVILSAHSASSDIMILAPLLLAAGYFHLSRASEPSRLSVLLMFAAATLCLYTPGAVWLIIAGLIATRQAIGKFFVELGTWKWWAALIFVALLTPLGLGLANSPHQILDWLALPQSMHVVALLKSIAWAFLALFWRSAEHNSLQIARESMVHLAQDILASLGMFALWQKARLKTYGLIFMIVLGPLLVGLSGVYSLSLIALAAVGVFIAAGLRYLHIEWQGVFPHNPIARGFALILIIGAVGFSVTYGVRYSLVAWPHTLATKQTYVLK